MPFDALVMRAMEARWQTAVRGGTCTRIKAGADRLLFTVKHPSQSSSQVLVVLKPGVARLHRVQEPPRLTAGAPAWLQNLLPFTIRQVIVPPFERVMIWDIDHADEWGTLQTAHLIIELAGHLTNLIVTDPDHIVIDAWHRISPGRPGRTIFPQWPYESPPPPPSGQPLPPWARQWLTEGGHHEQLMTDWERGFPGPGYRLTNRTARDVWVYPRPGFEAEAVDLERGLETVFEEREQKLQTEAVKAQLLGQLQNRIDHLEEKIAQYQDSRAEDPEKWKLLGDLWLTYQSRFTDPSIQTVTVEGFDGRPVTLTLATDKDTPQSSAQHAYRRYKKIKARRAALDQLIPALIRERAELADLKRRAVSGEEPIGWYRAQLTRTQGNSSTTKAAEPFRRFKSVNGLDIFVGRNRDENARLTFQKARPDDLWFHTKQSPGSHVILFCGRSQPDREDVLDAAALAVFFSPQSMSSNVPVDYTRRKFVRKRPHAEPGQVLYQREKTLYITPDAERLRRLKAISEKLVDD